MCTFCSTPAFISTDRLTCSVRMWCISATFELEDRLQKAIHWENFIEDLNLVQFKPWVVYWRWRCLLQNCGKAHDGGSSNERQQSHQLLSCPPTSSSSASHPLQSSVTLPPTYSSGYRCNIQEEGGRSECGKLAKNYPMPISPLLWPEWRAHWARPKVPTTTIEKRHNSNNIATGKSKSPWRIS